MATYKKKKREVKSKSDLRNACYQSVQNTLFPCLVCKYYSTENCNLMRVLCGYETFISHRMTITEYNDACEDCAGENDLFGP